MAKYTLMHPNKSYSGVPDADNEIDLYINYYLFFQFY